MDASKVLEAPFSELNQEPEAEQRWLRASRPASRLNPVASEFRPNHDGSSKESRPLFPTFSNGYPLNEAQIARFFTWVCGMWCAESVYVHRRKTRPGEDEMSPLFGKVMSTAPHYPMVVLGDYNEGRFWLEGKALWCKRFDPSKRNRRNENNDDNGSNSQPEVLKN